MTRTRPHVVDMIDAGIHGQPSPVTSRPEAGGDEEDAGGSAEISSAEGGRIADLLRSFHDRQMGMTQPLPGGAGEILYGVGGDKYDDLPEDRHAGTSRRVTAKIDVDNVSTRTSTPLALALRWAAGGACRLDLRGSPTALLVGTNALAAGLDPRSPDEERIFLLRYPFLLLESVLRRLDRNFAWEPRTAQRLEEGEIALHAVRLALYLPLGSREDMRRLLDWLYVAYCTPILDQHGRVFHLGSYLRLRADPVLGGDARPRGVAFRRYEDAARHPLVTVNFHDRKQTLTDAERKLLGADPAAEAWLDSHLRVDITLHRPMLQRLANAAGCETDTAAGFCRAVHAMDKRAEEAGELGFRAWLVKETLERYLHLPAILRFDAEAVGAARQKLRNRPHLMAVWDEWEGARRPSPETGAAPDAEAARSPYPSLRQLLKARIEGAAGGDKRASAVVRDNLRAVREAGLDPDIPPPFYHRLAMTSSLWGFDDEDAARYCRAVADRDWRTLERLLEKNRRFVATSRARFRELAERVLEPADVPALPCGGEGGKRVRGQSAGSRSR